jgi:hypothetical protein
LHLIRRSFRKRLAYLDAAGSDSVTPDPLMALGRGRLFSCRYDCCDLDWVVDHCRSGCSLFRHRDPPGPQFAVRTAEAIL